MKLIEEIKAKWVNHLHTFSGDVLLNFNISEVSRIFLSTIGLPFGLDVVSVYFYSSIKEFRVVKNRNIEYVVIGGDYATNICINCKNDGIYSVDFTNKLPTRFMNANIEKLITSIYVFLSFREVLKNCSDQEAKEIIGKISNIFRSFDANSLDHEANWWSIILEQTEVGLM